MHSAAYREKRQALRHDCVATIQWSPMSQSTVYTARILNFSPSGLYLETDESLKSGTTIWLRVNQCLTRGTAADCPECLPSTAVADTKWCRALPEKSGCRYGVGLKYLFPMI